MFEYNRKVQYYETDKMGVVHHSNYLRYFEEARIEYMASCDLPYTKTESSGIIIPVTGYSVKFKRSARFGDILNIISKVSVYNGIRLSVYYEVFREDDLLSTGTTEHTFLNRDFKVMRLQNNFPDYHKIFMTMLEDH